MPGIIKKKLIKITLYNKIIYKSKIVQNSFWCNKYYIYIHFHANLSSSIQLIQIHIMIY